MLRHGTPLVSLVVPGVSGHLSTCIWNLPLFLEDATEVSVPVIFYFILGITFTEVPGHRDLP